MPHNVCPAGERTVAGSEVTGPEGDGSKTSACWGYHFRPSYSGGILDKPNWDYLAHAGQFQLHGEWSCGDRCRASCGIESSRPGLMACLPDYVPCRFVPDIWKHIDCATPRPEQTHSSAPFPIPSLTSPLLNIVEVRFLAVSHSLWQQRKCCQSE